MSRPQTSPFSPRSRVSLALAAILALTLAAGTGCSETDPSKPATWISKLDRKDSKVVADAARELRKMKAQEAVPALIPLLSHEDANVRNEAAYALMEIGDPAAVKPLIDAIDLQSRAKGMERANTRIAEALGSLGDKQAVPALLKMTSSRDDLVRLAAVASLGKLRDDKAVSTLLRFVDEEHTPPLITKRAIEALGHIQAAEAIPALLRAMVLERKGVSFYLEASYALFQLGDLAVQPLIDLASGKNKEYETWAAEHNRAAAGYLSKAAVVLSDLGAQQAAPSLIKLLTWEDPTGNGVFELLVRGTAAESLGRLRVKEAAAPIAAQITVEEANIREKYAYALALIGDTRQLPRLSAATSNGHWSARKSAITGLALLGSGAQKGTIEAIIAKESPDAIFKSCMAEPGAPMEGEAMKTARCEKQKADRPKFLQEELGRLLAGEECKDQATCWVGKLSDENPRVRERAALELGKLGEASAVPALAKAASDDHLLARRAAFIALDLLSGKPEAKAELKKVVEPLKKQLVEEAGRAHTKVVNEDLRRVVWKLENA